MLVVITYDVNTGDAAGRRRLRQIARQCVNYGQRVQNSVFECLLDGAQCRLLQAKLLALMDSEKGSLRFYYLGNKYQTRIEHFGAKQSYEPEGVLMIGSGARGRWVEKTGIVRTRPVPFLVSSNPICMGSYGV